jgi:hypothetical protein
MQPFRPHQAAMPAAHALGKGYRRFQDCVRPPDALTDRSADRFPGTTVGLTSLKDALNAGSKPAVGPSSQRNAGAGDEYGHASCRVQNT